MNEAGIIPTGHRILVLPDSAEAKTAGGILLPEETKEREEMAQIFGQVIAVGPGAWADQHPPAPKVGDRVMFAKYAGIRHRAPDGNFYRILNDLDVCAIAVTGATGEPV